MDRKTPKFIFKTEDALKERKTKPAKQKESVKCLRGKKATGIT